MDAAHLLPGLLLIGSVGLIAGMLIAGIRRSGSGELPTATRNWTAGVVIGTVLWLTLSGILAAAGLLNDFSRIPPPIMLLTAAAGVLTIILAFSPVGTRLLHGLPIAWLVGFQGFRIIVEIMLDLLYKAGAIPVQMSYEGRNFDILSGASALVVAWLAARGRLPEWGLQLWNLFGFGLLLNIVVISIVSMPLPIRVFMNEPANTVIATWPLVWLPTFLVPAALFGHLLIARRLPQALHVPLRTRRAPHPR